MDQPAAPAVGIDLGTTFSAIACLEQSGAPRVLPNSEGDASTPSAVYFHDGGVAVGKEAVKIARYEPECVAQFAKRDMGKAHYSKTVRGQELPPELIQALILRQLKQDGSLALGDFDKAVITVPAYFNEPRRRATMDAGRLAGLEVLDIINEPTAAALAYGVRGGFLGTGGESARQERILVYDLGGGTFDVTLMEISGNQYRALATDGDVFLGGIDWDQRIADYLAEQFVAECGIELRADPTTMQSLLQEAEDAKRALTSRASVMVPIACDSHRARLPLTVELLEGMTSDLVDRTMFTVASLLREAGFKWKDVTRILLVGGSARMPMIRKALEEASGMRVDRSLLSEEPVAMGAALYAGVLLGTSGANRLETQIQNVSSHHLGVLGVDRNTGLPRRKVLIARNTPLPANGVGRFTTFRDGQRAVLVNVVEGGDDSGRNATPIGNCVVSDLPENLPAGTRIHVGFAYATNGRLTVTAAVPGMHARAAMTVERASGLSEGVFEDWRRWIERGAVLDAAADRGEEAESTTADRAGDATWGGGSRPRPVAKPLPASNEVGDAGEEFSLPDSPPASADPGGPDFAPDFEDFLKGLS